MSDRIFVRPTHRTVPPVINPRRRFRWLLLIILLFAAVLLAGRTAVSYYVDALWFGSLGYEQVFWKTLGMEWRMFIVFAGATFLILHLSFLALKRTHSPDFPGTRTILIAGQPLNVPLDRILRIITLAAELVIALASGGVMA